MESPFFTFIVSTITGIVTFIVGQKRASKELESISLKNIEHSLDIYNKIIDDLKNQVSNLLQKVNELEKKIDELVIENAELKRILREKNVK